MTAFCPRMHPAGGSTRTGRTQHPGSSPPWDCDPFLKFERLKTADDRFVVTPNYLTIHAYAAIDVKVSPVVLGAPGKLGGLEDIWRRR